MQKYYYIYECAYNKCLAIHELNLRAKIPGYNNQFQARWPRSIGNVYRSTNVFHLYTSIINVYYAITVIIVNIINRKYNWIYDLLYRIGNKKLIADFRVN